MTGPALYAVIRRHGPGWRKGRAMEEQAHWEEHDRFMDQLYTDGTVIMGGALEGTDEVLLVMQADNAGAVRKHLEGDPWMVDLILPIWRIRAWSLRLGAQ